MQVYANPWRGTGFPDAALPDIPMPADDPGPPTALLARCPSAVETPLCVAPDLARALGIAELWIKDERGRMGLGSFKALGAAYVIAYMADAFGAPLTGHTFVTASAGNHGLSVAAGAGVFGARAVIYIAETVPETFAARLRDRGAEVARAGADYAASMKAAEAAAADHGWTLLSDSSWPGYTDLPHRLMEGYLVMSDEVAVAIHAPPTHIFLQAGVGGMAAAVAAHARRVWGAAPHIAVVEPDLAPALIDSVRAGQAVTTTGGVSSMGRLDCKEPSLIALAGLARDADTFLTISEDEVTSAMAPLSDAGFATSPSGGAGLAAVRILGHRQDVIRESYTLSYAKITQTPLDLTPASRVLCILSEGR